MGSGCNYSCGRGLLVWQYLILLTLATACAGYQLKPTVQVSQGEGLGASWFPGQEGNYFSTEDQLWFSVGFEYVPPVRIHQESMRDFELIQRSIDRSGPPVIDTHEHPVEATVANTVSDVVGSVNEANPNTLLFLVVLVLVVGALLYLFGGWPLTILFKKKPEQSAE